MNLFVLPAEKTATELFIPLFKSEKIIIEKIVSWGHKSPEGFWYDQEKDEWVTVLQGQARLSYTNGRVINIGAGDFIFIPAGEKHRVDWTSEDPPCIWLAIHGHLK